MEYEVDVQVGTSEGSKQQRQGLRARAAWVLMIVSTPIFSPLLLVYLIIYQFCLVGVDKLSPQAKAVTAVAAIFFGIAWIPVVGVVLFLLDPTDDTNDRANALAPIGAFSIFCIWGSVVAFRHFSISDSYEPERERSNVKRLESLVIDPPLLVTESRHIPEAMKSADGPVAARKAGGLVEITNALQLYQVLKGDVRHTFVATAASVMLSAITVTIVRTEAIGIDKGVSQGKYSEMLYILSTVFFCGMFLVFYSTFTFIITIYVHQVGFIRRLTYAMDDNAPPRQRVVRVEAMHLKQLRGWEECRRLAVEELTSPKSILNAVFTPSMWLSALGTVGISSFLVARLLFQRQSYGQVSISFTILMAALVGFMGCAVGVAKLAQKHFKRHSALIAQKTFDIARQIDLYHSNLEQGIEEDEEESAGRRVSRAVAASMYTKSGSPLLNHSTSSDPGLAATETLSLIAMEQIYASLHSLCTFMIANQPRPLILGIELRHVRFVVVFVMLISGNVLFVSLMVAFKSNKCGQS